MLDLKGYDIDLEESRRQDLVSSEKEEKMVSLDCDLVVIGSGGGLAAAAAAAEKGIQNIIVLEKQGAVGGSSKMAQGLFAAESPIQKRENIIVDRDACFKELMKGSHWSTVNPRLVRNFINKSGDTIRWFQEKGIDFYIEMIYPSQKFRGWHIPIKRGTGVKGGGSELIKVLSEELVQKGVKVHTHTRAKRLLRGTTGEILGVEAESPGGELLIKAKSVIIATGGFGDNRQLLEKYCPDYREGMLSLGAPGHSGDGILMAASAGAAIADSVPIFHEGPFPCAVMGISIAGMVKEPGTVWINKIGRRFIDETAGFLMWDSGNAILMQPDLTMYTLIDDTVCQQFEEQGLIIGMGGSEARVGLPGLKKDLRKLAANNPESIKIADSLDEIAGWIGADPVVLKNEIVEYNSFCAQGYDATFSKDRRYLWPLKKAPYYAIKCSLICGETLGGVKVNENLEVLDKEGKVIRGLYAAGVIAHGWESHTYCGELCGSALGFAFNSGRMAGENAARFILDK